MGHRRTSIALALRESFATVTSLPWRRAPGLLLRRPSLLLATAGASAVVAATLAAVPLFSSSVGSASIELQVEERCPRDTGVSRAFLADPQAVRDPTQGPFTGITDHVGPQGWWVQLESAPLTGGSSGEPIEVALISRTAALEHVEVVEQVDGPGIWVSTRTMDRIGLHAGDRAVIGGTPVSVAGVYQDESGPIVDDFWCSNGYLFQPRGVELELPPAVVIVDRDTFATVMEDLGISSAEGAWEAPLRPDRTLTQVDQLQATLACDGDDSAVAWCSSGTPPMVEDDAGRFRGPVAAKDDADFVTRFLGSSLPFVSKRTRAIQTSVGGGVWAVAALATLAGLGLVAAAASLWSDRRRRAVALLTVRGVSRPGIGVKALLELLPAVVVGAVAGVGAAYAIVALLGPSPAIEPSALRTALSVGLVTVVASLATVGVVAAARARAPGSHARSTSRVIARIPWEAALALATVVSYRRLGEWGVPTGRGAEVSRVDLLGLLFPVLLLVTAVAVFARALVVLVRPLRTASRRWAFSVYLGIRRVARYRVAAIGMVAGAALAAGVLAYAATMNRSLDATLVAKGTTFVGSDAAVQLRAEGALPSTIDEATTEVRFFRRAWIEGDTREGVTVLGVDTATFARSARWDPTFADRGLATILQELADPGGGAVPAVVVGRGPADRHELGVSGTNTVRFEIAPLPGIDAFPGMKPQEPTVYVDERALDRLDARGGTSEVWVRGDREQTLDALANAGLPYVEVRTTAGVADLASFRTVAWTFGFLQSIGITAGLLVIGGLAVYLDARRRDRVLGYAFMRRMGLDRTTHRRALVVELVASVVVGAVMGIATAALTASLAHSRIDPVPRYAPAPLLRHATPTILAVLAITTIVTVLAALVGQRQVDGDDPVEVIRAGT